MTSNETEIIRNAYDTNVKKQEYLRAGISEEEVELIFTPISRYVKDLNILARARAAKEKYINFVAEENDQWRKEKAKIHAERFSAKNDNEKEEADKRNEQV